MSDNEFTENDLIKLDEKMSRIGNEIRQVQNDYNTHVKVEDITLSSMNSNIEGILSELKAQNKRFDKVLSEQREHIDAKIAVCHKIVNDKFVLHVTKDELTIVKDNAIKDAKVERDSQFRDIRNTIDSEINTTKIELIKQAKSHIQIIWFAGIIIITMGAYIFNDVKKDVDSHGIMYQKHLLENKFKKSQNVVP